MYHGTTKKIRKEREKDIKDLKERKLEPKNIGRNWKQRFLCDNHVFNNAWRWPIEDMFYPSLYTIVIPCKISLLLTRKGVINYYIVFGRTMMFIDSISSIQYHDVHKWNNLKRCMILYLISLNLNDYPSLNINLILLV